MPEFEIKGIDAGDAKGGKKESKKGSKIINTLKKKPFLIACIVVALLGLYVWYRNSQTESTHQNMLVADGYDALTLSGASSGGGGIPGGGSFSTGTAEDMTEEFIAEMEKVTNSFENQISDMQNSFNNTYDEMSSQIILLSDRTNTQESIIETQSQAIQLQNDIDAMKANSDAWHYAKSDAEKKALADANEQIASKYGWTRNDATGYWYDTDGNIVYSTVTQTQNSVSVPSTKTASSSSSAQSSVNKVVSDTQKRNDAVTGTSSTPKYTPSTNASSAIMYTGGSKSSSGSSSKSSSGSSGTTSKSTSSTSTNKTSSGGGTASYQQKYRNYIKTGRYA